MKKILFIHHGTSWGGAPINIFNIIQELDEKKYEPVFFLLRDCELVNYLKKYKISYQIANSKFYHRYYQTFGHLETSPTPWYKLFKYFKILMSWFLSRYFFAPKELRELDYDIYHLNSSVLSDWLKPCKEKGKTVFHIQETIIDDPKGIRYNFLRNQVDKYADEIVAISRHTAKKIDLPKKTNVLYNFTKLAQSKPSITSYQSNRVLYVGGQSPKKGFKLLVDALKYVNQDIRILFAGTYKQSSSRSNLKQINWGYRKKWDYLNKMRNSCQVEEIGLVPDIKPYLDECVCLISPFTLPHFSRPVIEAYANYKPVIVTGLSGVDEIVKTDCNKTGFIANKTPKDLANSINEICTQSELAKLMGKNGYNFAKKYFSAKNVEILETVYERLNLDSRTE